MFDRFTNRIKDDDEIDRTNDYGVDRIVSFVACQQCEEMAKGLRDDFRIVDVLMASARSD